MIGPVGLRWFVVQDLRGLIRLCAVRAHVFVAGDLLVLGSRACFLSRMMKVAGRADRFTGTQIVDTCLLLRRPRFDRLVLNL